MLADIQTNVENFNIKEISGYFKYYKICFKKLSKTQT